MRSLLAKHFGLKMKQENHNQDDESVLRLFGSSEKGNIQRARLQISDAFFLKRRKSILHKMILLIQKRNLRIQLIV